MPCWRNRLTKKVAAALEEFFLDLVHAISARPGVYHFCPTTKPQNGAAAWGNSTIPPTARLTPTWWRGSPS